MLFGLPLILPRFGEGRPAKLLIVPLSRVKASEIAAIRRALVKTYRLEIEVSPARRLPKETYYPPRKRYRADHLIAWLAKGEGSEKVLGVTRMDVSTTARGRKDWGVVGLGQLGGRSAVVSSFRLKGDLSKLGDVAVHEVGHILGRPHCPTAGCTMHDAEGKVGKIGAGLCPLCRRTLEPWLR